MLGKNTLYSKQRTSFIVSVAKEKVLGGAWDFRPACNSENFKNGWGFYILLREVKYENYSTWWPWFCW